MSLRGLVMGASGFSLGVKVNKMNAAACEPECVCVCSFNSP